MGPVRVLPRAGFRYASHTECAVEEVAGASGGRTFMTLMLILGAVAAFYCLLLLFRCATYALPIFAGLGLAFTLRDQGFG